MEGTSFERFLQKNRWAIDDLERLSSNDLDKLIAEIPSDNESVGSDCDLQSDDEEEVNFVINECPLESSMETNSVLEEEATDNEELPAGNDFLFPSDTETNNIIDEEDLPLINFVPDLTQKYIWRKNCFPRAKVENFTEVTGPNIGDDSETPIEIFLELFSIDLLEKIVFETNLYATQSGKPFVPATIEELKIFLGINLMMGIKRLPSYKDFWSSLDEMRDHYISSLMSRARFSWFLGNLHLADNNLQPKKYGSKRRCNLCSTKANPHRSRVFCTTCKVALCLQEDRNCFKLFHEKNVDVMYLRVK